MKRGVLISGILASALMPGPALEISAMNLPLPALPAAEDLAGEWRLEWHGGRCALTLSASPVAMPRPAADAWTLTLAPSCAGNDALASVSAWRPASDGLAMVDAQGRTRLFLSRTGPDVYDAALPSGQSLRLMRD